MLKVRKNDMETLEKAIPNINELLEKDEFSKILDILDDIYVIEGLDRYDEPTDYGYLIEKVRDHLYDDNIDAYSNSSNIEIMD